MKFISILVMLINIGGSVRGLAATGQERHADRNAELSVRNKYEPKVRNYIGSDMSCLDSDLQTCDSLDIFPGLGHRRRRDQSARMQALHGLYSELQLNNIHSGTGETPDTHTFAITVPWFWLTFYANSIYYLPSPSDRNNRPQADLPEDWPGLSVNRTQCQVDVDSIYFVFHERNITENITFADAWPLQLVDSWGKSMDGLFVGNFFDRLGFMKECLDVDTSNHWEADFRGQYCLVQLDRLKNATHVLPSTYGTCMPHSCTVDDLQSGIEQPLLDNHNHTVVSIYCQQKDQPQEFGTWEIVTCTIIGLMVAVVVVATVADLCLSGRVWPVLKSFSAAQNIPKILAVRVDAAGEISCLHAIRVISLCWIILGHEYVFILPYTSNPMELPQLADNWPYQLVWSSYKAVDTFFLIGALLVSRSLFSSSFCLAPQTSRLRGADNIAFQSSTEPDGTGRNPPVAETTITQEHDESNGKLEARVDNTSEAARSEIDLSSENVYGIEPDVSRSGLPVTSAARPDSNSKHTAVEVFEEEVNGVTKQDGKESSQGLINNELIEKLKAQGLGKTLSIFLPKYVLYIIFRIVRLWPAMFFVVMLCAGPSVFFVSGPLKGFYESEYLAPCRQNWWVDLSFFINFFARIMSDRHQRGEDLDRSADSCIAQIWYVAADFQIYLFLPFLLLPVKLLRNSAQVGYLLCFALISCLIPAIIVMAHDLVPASIMTLQLEKLGPFTLEVYLMPYTRASPYFAGALVALLLLRVDAAKQKGEKLNWLTVLARKRVLALCWMLFVATSLGILLCLESVNKFTLYDNTEVMTDFENFLYAGFANFIWACCVGWLIAVCALRLAEPVNMFLSHPFWQPLSRCSFSAYLICLPMQYMMFYSFYRNVYMTHATIILSSIGVAVVSFVSAFFISVIAEAPYINLLKLLNSK